MTKVSELVSDNKPEIKLYEDDLKDIRNMDVDDRCTLRIKVKAISKYREEYRTGEPLCITFKVLKVNKENN